MLTAAELNGKQVDGAVNHRSARFYFDSRTPRRWRDTITARNNLYLTDFVGARVEFG